MLAIEHEIASQPETWRRAAALAPDAAPVLRTAGRVAIIGCGTSYFMAQAIAALREGAGLGETDAFSASELPPGRRYDAVVAISRSGTTTEVVRALESLGDGVRSSAICAVAGTGVPETAGDTVLLDFADEEAVVQTRFATAVLALARELTDEVGVGAIAAEAEAVLAAPLPEGLARFDHFVFLSSGWSVGLASEAALKLRESAGAWSEAYSAMEYRHGPVSATRPTTLVWALGAVEPGVLATAAHAGATVVDSGRDAMVELVLVQRAAVELARARGLDPDRPRHLTRSVVLDGDGVAEQA